MAMHGSVGEFDPAKEDWSTYSARLGFYFQANGVTEADRKRAILLSCSGPETFRLARSLASPRVLNDLTYKEIGDLMEAHYNPKKSEAVQRYKFNSRVRHSGESVSTYIAELKKLAIHCGFNDENTLKCMLCDRLVCGINDSRMQHRLLAEPDLDYDKAFKIVLAMESAAENTSSLEKTASQATGGSDNSVHRVGRSKRPSKSHGDSSKHQEPSQDSSCYRCGGKHRSSECRFKTATCRYCSKLGHIARVCRTRLRTQKKKQPSPDTNHLSVDDSAESSDHETLHLSVDENQPALSPLPPAEYPLFQVSGKSSPPMMITVSVHGKDLLMEVDTGAALSVISKSTYLSTWSDKTERPPLKHSNIKLTTYSGESLGVCGSTDVSVIYKQQSKKLSLQVLSNEGPSLLGRDWLKHLVLDWKQLNSIRQQNMQSLQEVLDDHADVFKEELGTLQGVEVPVRIKPEAQPHFYRPRPVPYSMRQKVENELTRLQEQGVITQVPFSDWAAPIVPVLKGDGSIRICGDYKLTVNSEATPDVYPLPRVEDLFSSLSSGTLFSKLDLSHAYLQLQLDDSSKKYTTINTSRGLFQYNRLPFGVSCAPAVFQRTMENLLQGIPGVCVYLDDVLVTGKTATDHLVNLRTVLSRFQKAGMRLKRQKCRFMLSEIEYLGHKISSRGLQPSEEKVKAMKEAPRPTNLSQLKSFLGLANYYGRFLPNLSTTLAPLYQLLKKNTTWSWGDKQEQAFQSVKTQLSSAAVLAHYDPQQKLLLTCDASPYGLGAVLSHRLDDGTDRPIAFTSRSLSPPEKKYSQLDKEALAIIFGITRFRQYLLGRHFTICSDHKPLMYLFGESRGIPELASSRIQRWALTLSAYTYSIVYRAGSKLANADGLSRLPLPEAPVVVPVPPDTVLLLESLQVTPVTARQVKQWTARDPVLSRVLQFTLQGWPSSVDDYLIPYFRRKDELSVQDGCLLWGLRVIIPPPGREAMLTLLHESHPGISKIKGLARSYIWWPGLDKALEDEVRHCQQCQEHQRQPAKAPLHPWDWPERPWSRVHADFAGPFLGKVFLLVIDSHSKWLEVFIVPSTSTQAAVDKFRLIFSTHGLPEMLVTDNGPAFTSSDFELFVKRNGIRHVTSSPYHPSTNGLVERAVQTFKQVMKKTTGPLETRICRFLLSYRLTPHSSTGQSPAEMLMSRRPRSLLDLVFPQTRQHVRRSQERQMEHHNKHCRARSFQLEETVLARNFSRGPAWLRVKLSRSEDPSHT